eukprot:Lankesteria_metandrocarpae@DN889_c0_g1_i1.p1
MCSFLFVQLMLFMYAVPHFTIITPHATAQHHLVRTHIFSLKTPTAAEGRRWLENAEANGHSTKSLSATNDKPDSAAAAYIDGGVALDASLQPTSVREGVELFLNSPWSTSSTTTSTTTSSTTTSSTTTHTTTSTVTTTTTTTLTSTTTATTTTTTSVTTTTYTPIVMGKSETFHKSAKEIGSEDTTAVSGVVSLIASLATALLLPLIDSKLLFSSTAAVHAPHGGTGKNRSAHETNVNGNESRYSERWTSSGSSQQNANEAVVVHVLEGYAGAAPRRLMATTSSTFEPINASSRAEHSPSVGDAADANRNSSNTTTASEVVQRATEQVPAQMLEFRLAGRLLSRSCEGVQKDSSECEVVAQSDSLSVEHSRGRTAGASAACQYVGVDNGSDVPLGLRSDIEIPQQHEFIDSSTEQNGPSVEAGAVPGDAMVVPSVTAVEIGTSSRSRTWWLDIDRGIDDNTEECMEKVLEGFEDLARNDRRNTEIRKRLSTQNFVKLQKMTEESSDSEEDASSSSSRTADHTYIQTDSPVCATADALSAQ